MGHWNNLSVDAQRLLRKLIEGSRYEPSDKNLTVLAKSGLIEKSGDGWQPTRTGLSVYAIRDDPRTYELPQGDVRASAA